MNSDAVGQAMRDVADDIIRPRFRTLADGDIDTKSGPGDLVTIADVEAERALTPLLAAIVDQPVVGEEASEADPSLPDILGTASAGWTVDPVDGTWNFAHGSIDYAVMVGHVDRGEAHTGWILYPETGNLLAGGVDAPVTVTDDDGFVRTVASVAGEAARPVSQLRGMAVVKFASDDAASGLADLANDVGEVTQPRMCAGWDYWDVIDGDVD
ncbi:MAG: inositol monophosphatase family protein, partial [Demequina sp.]